MRPNLTKTLRWVVRVWKDTDPRNFAHISDETLVQMQMQTEDGDLKTGWDWCEVQEIDPAPWPIVDMLHAYHFSPA